MTCDRQAYYTLFKRFRQEIFAISNKRLPKTSIIEAQWQKKFTRKLGETDFMWLLEINTKSMSMSRFVCLCLLCPLINVIDHFPDAPDILLVMSSSCNLPIWAKPSWKGSESSQAELGHFNFWAETELTKCISISSKF